MCGRFASSRSPRLRQHSLKRHQFGSGREIAGLFVCPPQWIVVEVVLTTTRILFGNAGRVLGADPDELGIGFGAGLKSKVAPDGHAAASPAPPRALGHISR